MLRHSMNGMIGFIVTLFLLLPNVSNAALLGDFNNDGVVSISEVQTCINSFLGIIPTQSSKTPTGLTALAFGTSINLTWDPVINATGYIIYWGNSTGVSKSSTNKILVTSGTSYQHMNLTIGTTYYYVVTSVTTNWFSDSAASAEVSAQNTHYFRESETNNITSSATPITIGGDSVRGQLSSDTDLDYYSFTSNGGVVSFEIKPEDAVKESGWVRATILASNGSTIISSINITGGPSVWSGAYTTETYNISATLPAGLYYLMFDRLPSNNIFRKDYVVSSSYNTSMIREIEPNNTLATATPITIGGGTIRGQLSRVTDVDYYSFTSTGGIVSFAIKPEDYDTATGKENGHVQASIISSDGTTIMSAIEISIVYPTQSYNLSATLPTGMYYLKFEVQPSSWIFTQDYIVTY